MILLQMVAKWWCIKLCAFFFWATLYTLIYGQLESHNVIMSVLLCGG